MQQATWFTKWATKEFQDHRLIGMEQQTCGLAWETEPTQACRVRGGLVRETQQSLPMDQV